jgi:hypothetical protein
MGSITATPQNVNTDHLYGASIPITITIAQRGQLLEMGYTEADVNAMKPSEAHAILNVGNTNGHPPEDDIESLIAGSMIDPATIIDALTAKEIAALLPTWADYTGNAYQAATDALRLLIGYLPKEEREALELPLLQHWFKAKRDLDQFLENCPPPPGEPVFHLESLADLFNRPGKVWLIDQVIGAGDIGMIYGGPGSGKTFVAIDLIFAACLGQQWAGRFDVPRRLNVVYCAGEGISGLKERFRAAAVQYNVTNLLPGFSFSALVPQLYSDGADAMHNFVTEWKGRANAPALDLLIIDTMHSATVGADENSAQDMGQVLAAAKVATNELGCAVGLVHHTNKNGSAERGSSAMRGAMDVMIEIRRISETGTKAVMTCAKLKDGEAWKDQTFDLIAVGDCESVRVAWDAPNDGEAATGKTDQDVTAIIALLKKTPGARYTANVIAESIGIRGSKVVYKLIRKAAEQDDGIRQDLRRPDKDSSPHNPLMYWWVDSGAEALTEAGL